MVFNLSIDDLAWLPYHIAIILSLLARQLQHRAEQIFLQDPHEPIAIQLLKTNKSACLPQDQTSHHQSSHPDLVHIRAKCQTT